MYILSLSNSSFVLKACMLGYSCMQIAELSKTHAEEKENEAKLLSRSVEELESTVYALETQVSFEVPSTSTFS